MGNACMGKKDVYDHDSRGDTDKRSHLSVICGSGTAAATSASDAPCSQSSASTDGETEVVKICKVSDFTGRSRIVNTRSREIAVWKINGKFFALDNACYHHGAPLVNGDIEELDGRSCIICPWHGYRITLGEGEGLYWGLGPDMKKSCVKSKGVKQRPHTVTEKDGVLYLKVSNSGRVESDGYTSAAGGVGAGGSMHSAAPGKTFGAPPAADQQQTATGESRTKEGEKNKYLRDEPQVNPEPVLLLTTRKQFANKSKTACLFSFELVVDESYFKSRNLPPGHPGQHATLVVPVSESVFVERSWTVVNWTSNTCFDIIIKRKHQGLASNWVLDNLDVGTPLELKGFGGDFGVVAVPPVSPVLPKHVYLFSAGVGITPMLSILHVLFGVSTAGRMKSPQGRLQGMSATLIHTDRGAEHIPQLEFVESCIKSHPDLLDVHFFTTSGDVPHENSNGVQYYSGRPVADRVGPIIRSRNIPPASTYICGPEGFFQSISDMLVSFDPPFPAELLMTESFS